MANGSWIGNRTAKPAQAIIDAKLRREQAKQPSAPNTGIQTYQLKGASAGGVAVQDDKMVTTDNGKVVAENIFTKSTQNPAVTKTDTTTQTSTAVPTYDQPEGGVMSNTGEQSGKPHLKADGTFDPNYIPKSEEEILALGADEYMTNKLFANYYKSKGVDISNEAAPESFDEALKIFGDKQKKAKSQLEEQINQSKKLAEEQKVSGQSANQAGLTAGREGVQSQGNIMSRDEIDLAFESRYNSQLSQLTQQMDSLNEQLAAQQAGLITGRGDQIRAQMSAVAEQMANLEKAQAEREKQSMDVLKMLSENGALAGLDPDSIAYLQDAMPGAPAGVIQLLSQSATRQYMDEKTKTNLDNATKGVGMMKDLVASGVVLNDSAMMSFAQQTGLPLEAIMSFNQAATNIMNDKSLDQATKTMNLQKLTYELDRQSRGITNAELEKVDYLSNLYKSGASQEEIARAKNAMGIKDEDDPMYRAELDLKQAQATIERKRINGEPISIDDQIKLLEAEENYGGLGGYNNIGGGISGEAYLPTKPSLAGVKVSYDNGKFNVTVPPNTEFQCGAFVNRAWGERVFGSLGEEKEAAINKNGFRVKGTSEEELAAKVKPGMAFVMPIANNKWDHVGLVQRVTPEGIVTIEANANGKAKTDSVGPGANNITSRFIPWNQLYGFMAPPNGKTVGGVPTKSESAGGTSFDKYFQEAKASGLSTKEAKKRATEKVNAELDKQASGGKLSKEQLATANQFRDEFNGMPQVKAFKEVQDKYQTFSNIIDSKLGGPGDLAIVYEFMKALDPTSVVRETEFASAANSGNIFAGSLAKYNGYLQPNGGFLPDEVKTGFKKVIENKLKVSRESFNREKERYGKLAKDQDIPEEYVIFDYDVQGASEPQQSPFESFFNRITGQNKKPKVIDTYGDYYIPETDPTYLTDNDI